MIIRRICKARSALYNDTPLDSYARDCIHNESGGGPECSMMVKGFCKELILRDGEG
jgi:hypothetical protein